RKSCKRALGPMHRRAIPPFSRGWIPPAVDRPGPTAATGAPPQGDLQEWTFRSLGIPSGGGGVMIRGMRAQVLARAGTPLVLREVDVPQVGPEQVRVRVSACGVCRTDLHVFDGELPHPKLPLVLGHQIVGTVAERGAQVGSLEVGQRVGIPWLGWTDGTC